MHKLTTANKKTRIFFFDQISIVFVKMNESKKHFCIAHNSLDCQLCLNWKRKPNAPCDCSANGLCKIVIDQYICVNCNQWETVICTVCDKCGKWSECPGSGCSHGKNDIIFMETIDDTCGTTWVRI